MTNKIYGKNTLESLDLIADLAMRTIDAVNNSEDKSVQLSNDSLELLSNGFLFLYYKLQETATIPAVSSRKQMLH